ncbi:MAG TPA: hypothetical protein VNR41_05295 [Xanthobacteraceae bacterium]|nr:hypothetical protein [Xanthobacteraceae bacterium]
MLRHNNSARVCGLRVIFASFFLSAASIAHADDKKDIDHSRMHGMDHSPTKETDHSRHEKPKENNTEEKSAKAAKPKSKKSNIGSHAKHAGHGETKRQSTDHSAHAGTNMQHDMTGFFGPYSITREGSGTSWLPDATPHEGIHTSLNGWMFMTHALVNGVYDSQGGPRGGDKFFVPGMFMGMAQKEIDDRNTIGFRAMLSPDPLMGPRGYPLLLATGETADGKSHLVDRQHPHDLFMELSTTYSYKLSPNSSFFVYAGLPGEPALGPSAFMHRTSGMDIPEAPITHHWLDSTHITFGVVTAGVVLDNVKLEASAFKGREPDQHRYDIEAPKLDSYSARATWNPTKELSMQVSWGHITSPESLSPGMDENRLTASATYTTKFAGENIWSTTFAWGRKMLQPGPTLDGFLLESEVILKNNWTFFARAERVKENELLHDIPVFTTAPSFYVSKVSVGGIYDWQIAEHLKFGLGALVSKYGIPDVARPYYGSDPTSYMVFFRLKVS